MPHSAVLLRVDVPEVAVPLVDLADVRRLAGALEHGADRLAAAAWRLGGARAAMADALGWCGPAADAFLQACAEQRDWFDNAWAALGVAAAICRRYATEAEAVIARAQQAAATAQRLGAELAELRELVRRVDVVRAAAPLSGAGAIALFTSEGDTATETARLQLRADRLAADAAALRLSVEQLMVDLREVDASSAAGLDRVTAMTLAARSAALRSELEHARAADRHENGGALSHVRGFLGALRDDVTEPLSLLGGLVGLDGDIGEHWSTLGSSLARGVTHPAELAGAVVDWADLRDGNWGHWLGTAGPTVAASFVTAGGYAAVKSADVAEMLASADAVARRIAALTDLADSAAVADVLAGRLSWSDVVLARDGLGRHEAAGGHTLDKHVGLTVAELAARFTAEGRFTASTFLDRATAEQAIGETLDANSGSLASWLVATEGRPRAVTNVQLELNRAVGLSLRPGEAPRLASKVKVVLIRDGSAVGFSIRSAYLVR